MLYIKVYTRIGCNNDKRLENIQDLDMENIQG